MRVLVTGAAGFIGRHLCDELGAAGHDVHGIDFQAGNLRHPGVIARHLDRVEPDVCVHLAAKVGRLFGEDNVAETILDNAGMTALVAQACGERGVQLAYASTSEVYGDLGETIAFEGGRMRLPHNIYGLSKRWGEEVGKLYAPRGLVCLRLSMPYGPGLPAGRGRAAMINFLHNALHRQPLTVHRGAERSWCWVGDTVRGIRMIIEAERSAHLAREHVGMVPGAGAWNVGRDDIAVPMRTVAEMACLMTGAPLDLIQDVEPPDRQTVVKRLSTAKLRRIGWEPTVELAEGMERTLEWVKAAAPAISVRPPAPSVSADR